jgi:hypothetical protein
MRCVTRDIVRTVLIAFVLLPIVAGSAGAADDSVEYPLAHGKLSLVDGRKPNGRRIVLKARFDMHTALENPLFAGATLRVVGGSPTDGDSGLIQLAAAKWHALGKGKTGYRYEDASASAGGIRHIMVKQGKKRGVLKIVGGRANWRYAVTGPQTQVAITFTIGKGRWCAEFKSPFIKNVARKVVARSEEAPASCPCERFESTWAAIQDAIFERHGCTTALCHGASAQGGLNLSAEVAYQNLVDVHSPLGGMNRIEPGDQARSFLWLKLAKGTFPDQYAAVPGTGMPNALPPLPENELEAVRRWIRAGAPETGVVGSTEDLLSACLPPPDPIKIRPPDPPAADVGVQLHAPPWEIPAQSEDEVCYATYYDFSATIPLDKQRPCIPSLGGPDKQCFLYKADELTQDANSHHSIIHAYLGDYDIAAEIYSCRGGANRGDPCTPGGDDCPGSTCQGGPVFGPFACLGGDRAGQVCDPKAPDCPGGGCAGRVQSTIACIGYGPPDFGFSLAGAGTSKAPSIGGSQQPLLKNAFAEGVSAMLPVKGVIVWNSHAFNLTDAPTSNEQWFDLYFADPNDQTPVRGIFDSRDIFVQDVPAFEKREYCRTFTLPQNARLFQFSSHTHKRGKLFRVWGPGITEECGSEDAIKPADCQPESSPPIFTTTDYSDPMVLTYDPPVPLNGADPSSRRYKFCSIYDNGATIPEQVKRQSTSPAPPFGLGALEELVGGPCLDDKVTCLDGPKKGVQCNGDNSVCDSSPGLGDGVCDACPVHGGVTTEDEMFILLGLYYLEGETWPAP